MLTEKEIAGCIRENSRLAAQHCDDLSGNAVHGPSYIALRDELKLIEGACRQLGAWRGDYRWSRLSLQMEVAHQKAGEWLRGIPTYDANGKFTGRMQSPRELFAKLAENLRALFKKCDDMQTRATGKVGVILPADAPIMHRDTKPIGWRAGSPSIILPN